MTTRTVLAMVLGLAAPAVAAPSFDCAKASGQVEELVCKDDALAALDRRLAQVYAEAEKRLPAADAARQRSVQRGWVKGRNDCWKDEHVRACVEYEYRTRIVALRIMSGRVTAPTAVGYRCEGAEGTPFAAAFYSDLEPKAAVLTFGDDQVTAFVAPSASGARYVAPHVELWEHHGEATLTWFGRTLACTKLRAPGGERPGGE